MKTKEQIMKVLENAYEDSRYMLIGEQLIGPSDLPNDMFGRFGEATGGRMPAILGLDLACYGLDLMNVGVGTERWNTILDQVTAFAEKGGIVTASSHWANPTYKPEYGARCRGMFGDGTAKYWDELLTEGTEINKIWKEELIVDGKFLKELSDRGITVLWRPLHESNGSWFWFTAKSGGWGSTGQWMDAEYLRRLWKYLYNLYVNEMDIENLIWVYGPNIANEGGSGIKSAMYYYPGDEYVDMLGIDWYTSGDFDRILTSHSYDKIMSRGKPCAMTEFGPAGEIALREDHEAQEKAFNAVDMLNVFKDITRRGLKIAYVLTWHENYGAIHSLGKGKEALDEGFFYDLERLNTLYE
ncbi:MAG: hypothetical protein IJZ89_00615 [Clostridia bacterium]|nr:hypothetical protein [Clostridia bacterium]